MNKDQVVNDSKELLIVLDMTMLFWFVKKKERKKSRRSPGEPGRLSWKSMQLLVLGL